MMRFLPLLHRHPRVAVIRLHGAIASGPRGRINDATFAPLIERAFRRGKPDAVALSINSPGGSPVQSSMVATRIRRLAEEKEVPVFAFVEDVAASGGYWLACAADRIYADKTSIVGSIGVIFATFGANEFIAKHGVERRVYTAGENKSQLDPFRPEDPEDVARIKAIGGEMHEVFIDHVKTARGDRLKEDAGLFTGEFCEKVRFAVYGPRRSMLRRFGAALAGDALAAVEERALWARFGL